MLAYIYDVLTKANMYTAYVNSLMPGYIIIIMIAHETCCMTKGVLSMYRLDAEPRELRDLVSRGPW